MYDFSGTELKCLCEPRSLIGCICRYGTGHYCAHRTLIRYNISNPCSFQAKYISPMTFFESEDILYETYSEQISTNYCKKYYLKETQYVIKPWI